MLKVDIQKRLIIKALTHIPVLASTGKKFFLRTDIEHGQYHCSKKFQILISNHTEQKQQHCIWSIKPWTTRDNGIAVTIINLTSSKMTCQHNLLFRK